jgi:hypothetical protein
MKNYSAFNSNEETSITFEKMGSQRREKRILNKANKTLRGQRIDKF